MRFPPDFLWGAATSAYQIEGSPLADGAGPSIWHVFAHTPGRTENGETGDIACDHYHRWPEDIRLMKELGLGAYRFSIAWGRVLPAGSGDVNRAGLDFYARLVDALLAAGIQPYVTLYHWDLPQALEERGGWLNTDIAGWFADYAQVMFRALGDRVPLWATLNEPWVVMDGGYFYGVHAPGRRVPLECPHVSHNLLRAHGLAVQVYRAEARKQIGIVINLEPKEPASDSRADREAASRDDAYMNRQFLDPVLLGGYPAQLQDVYGEAWPDFPPADLDLIHQPIDFLGVNYYRRAIVRHDDDVPILKAETIRHPGGLLTEMGWEVHPESLTRVLLWIRERYGDLPLYITENGAAFADPPHVSAGRLADPLRIDYLRRHLLAAHEALAQGVDLRGYFVWSLLDNYEWALGYAKRMGIIHVDYETQARTIKDSGLFYRDVIRSQGAALWG
jgi:beta-glucosidase